MSDNNESLPAAARAPRLAPEICAVIVEWLAAERERCARLVEDFDFSYREVPPYGSIVDERESVIRLVESIRKP